MADPSTPDAAWRNEIARTVCTEEALAARMRLDACEREGIRGAGAAYPWRITPYYAGLMDPDDPACPIRRQAIPSPEELIDPLGRRDPIGEEPNTVAPGLIRLYRDRVAWCVTPACPVNCRFCFRKRLVGSPDATDYSAAARRDALAFIARTPEIRDVLVTGGDPLMLPDDAIDDILGKLRAIPHVEIVRIGTRVPVTLPRRVTPELCAMLGRHHPLWINTHFNHPKELTPEAMAACACLAAAGIPLGNQSVLLKGVNDDVQTMRRLVQGLVRARVRPYYLFQCHLVPGTAHFRTPVETGLAIVEALRGSTTGFAIPTYVVDTPHGKVALSPQNIVERTAEAVVLRCPDGSTWTEPNPRG
jgi:lysine 2,3-aminomutase